MVVVGVVGLETVMVAPEGLVIEMEVTMRMEKKEEEEEGFPIVVMGIRVVSCLLGSKLHRYLVV